MRLAIIHMGLFYCGGGERTVLNEAIGFQNRGHEVTVFCPTVNPGCYPELTKEIEIKDFCWWLPYKFPNRNALGMIYSAISSPAIVKYFRDFDVVLAHSQPSNWIAYQVKRYLKIPYVSYLHQANRFLYPRDIDKITGWSTDTDIEILKYIHKIAFFISRLDRISLEGAEKLLVNSKWVKNQVKKWYGLEPEVCYPGVNTEKFRQIRINDESREQYILSTNRHYPQKCLHMLLRVFSMIQSDYPRLRCYLTGAYTKHTNHLLEYARKLKISEKVVFTNKLNESDLLDLYRGAYVYTFTSPEEDLGLGPIEAGALDVPSIVWDNAGPQETVLDGITGYRVKPFDVEEMSKKHLCLLGDPALRCEMGLNASRFIHETFTWKNHIDILEKTLSS